MAKGARHDCLGAMLALIAIAAPGPVGRTIGDPLAPAVRVMSLDTLRERATVSLSMNGTIIVLEVMPGRDIEVLYPSTRFPSTLRKAGTHTFDLGRYEDVPRYTARELAERARQALAACEARLRAQASRAAAAARAVKRDSTGKIISSPPGVIDQRDVDSCDRLSAGDANPLRSELKSVRLPRREPRERYLVVLAANEVVSIVDLNRRLTEFTAIGSDAATTIHAIATGVYGGRDKGWAGYYVAW